ncbi:MAG: Lrp/AsnC family transcriptional regulator [Candidatus Nanohaloarchaea archaeon]|nr:Lrp/AsnC family transcriptional regulator [Candidatus Nanohaloarchaea archaeon]
MTEEYEIDELDRKIITKLQEDGRKSFREIASEIDSTAVTVINRVDKMKDKGIIRGYTVDIDYRKIGYHIVAAIELIVKGEHMKEIEDKLYEHPRVTAVYEITGDTDILLVAKFKDRDQLGSFVVGDLLDSNMIEKTITHVAFDTYMERHNVDLMEDMPEAEE